MEHAFSLKPLSPDAIPAALAKAERYRLLNEPDEAESICLDVLRVDPHNQAAIVMMVLAMTDQFPAEGSTRAVVRVDELAQKIADDYERAYYSGIIRERRAKATLQRVQLGGAAAAAEWLRDAMRFYEQAEAVRPAMNDDVLLRWNACARLLMELPMAAVEERGPVAVQSE